MDVIIQLGLPCSLFYFIYLRYASSGLSLINVTLSCSAFIDDRFFISNTIFGVLYYAQFHDLFDESIYLIGVRRYIFSLASYMG